MLVNGRWTVLECLVRLLAIPAFAPSVRPDHIKAGYYSIEAPNPNGIVAVGPRHSHVDAAAHGR